MRIATADKDSDEMHSAVAAHNQFLSEAGNEAKRVLPVAKGTSLYIANFVLGSVYYDQDKFAEAIPFHSSVATKVVSACGNDLAEPAIKRLIDESESIKRPDESEKWFRYFASHYEPSNYDWDQEGDRRSSANDLETAALAYERAANGNSWYSYDYCFASAHHFYATTTNEDGVLADGRKCIDASVKRSSKVKSTLLSDSIARGL